MAKKNVKPVYPADLKTMLDPVVQAVKQLMDGVRVSGLKDPHPYIAPIDHSCSPAVNFSDDDDAAEKLVLIAFQYGICQGYAMRNKELQDVKMIYDSMATLLFRGGAE